MIFSRVTAVSMRISIGKQLARYVGRYMNGNNVKAYAREVMNNNRIATPLFMMEVCSDLLDNVIARTGDIRGSL